jgi:pyridoxamine 5'-phosphate oxidase
MDKNYHNIREEYLKGALDESSVPADPLVQFHQWMNQAIEEKVPHPTSMLLATCGTNGQPSCRVVLLKNADKTGFQFFTNYDSKKGQQLAQNPKAALTFFWMQQERQIRIEGHVEKVSPEVSDQYFYSRPYESRLSAAISAQSSIVENRRVLERAKEGCRTTYPNQNVPRPVNWGGYLLKPTYYEFWQGRESRLHDRIAYFPENGGWQVKRLAP